MQPNESRPAVRFCSPAECQPTLLREMAAVIRAIDWRNVGLAVAQIGGAALVWGGLIAFWAWVAWGWLS